MYKKSYLFIIPALVMNVFSCPDDDDFKSCHKDCVNGTFNQGNCGCDCNYGYTGELCDYPVLTYSMHADVSYDGDTSYAYDPPDFDLLILDHVNEDTLWIDGYDDVKGSYCFMRLRILDHTKIIPGTTYPIDGGSNTGTCWAAFIDPAQDAHVYGITPTTGGSLKITDYQPGTRIAGTFDFTAQYNSSKVNVKGSFDGK